MSDNPRPGSRLVALVNDVWEKRDQIEPDLTIHERLQPLELYRLLPGTNCKACGEATCFNLALKLAAGQVELAACTPLMQEPAYEERRARLASSGRRRGRSRRRSRKRMKAATTKNAPAAHRISSR